ncbi:MAG: GtrA family protein [Geminicoccaceae bacterium]
MEREPAAGRPMEFGRFLAMGGVSATVNWLSRMGYSQLMPFSAAVIVAYVTGMAVAFMLFRSFVFPKVAKPIRQQVIWFVLVNLAGVTQVWLASMFLVTILFPAIGFRWYPEAIGHGIGMCLPVVSSYFGHKHLTYQGRRSGRG